CETIARPVGTAARSSVAPRMSATATAAAPVSAAEAANTVAGEPTTISTLASIGPRTLPISSIVPATTLAATRSDGVCVTAGISDPITGRVKLIAVAATAANA